MEERIRIPTGSLTLDGVIDARPGRKGVIITHPHPLYGGNMHNNVVRAIAASYARAGYTTLRFNFRGVGESDGAYDNGEGEKEDVRSASKALARQGAESIHLAGYSFGAWVNAAVLDTLPEIEAAVMVSPPVDFMDFSFLGPSPRILLVVTGELDDIAGAAHVEAMLPQWNPKALFHVIQGADHFYGGHEEALQSVLDAFLDSRPGPHVD